MAAAVAAGAAAVLLAVASYPGDGQEGLRLAHFASTGHAIPIVGLEMGIFDAEGRVFESGPQVIEAMFAGSIDAAYVGPGPAINGHINSGGRLQVLAGAASGGASFVAYPGSGISHIGDFGGKRIAAPQLGNTQDVSLRDAMYMHGLEPAERGGSVTIHNVSPPDIYTLFAKGDVDGAWVAEPWATILVEDLGGKRLFYEEELWPGGEFASVLLIADSEYARENPGIISGLLDSHNRTASWINANPGGARDHISSFLDSYLGRSLPDSIIDEALHNTEITADPKVGSVYAFAEKADRLGYLGRHGYDISGLFYGGP